MFCKQCKIYQYCCTECQADNWPKHKNLCNAVRMLGLSLESKPPPIKFSFNGIFLRGTLDSATHRIMGIWSKNGLSTILNEPNKCEIVKLEHKTTGDYTMFPLSGSYTGFLNFNVDEMIMFEDFVINFMKNSKGYHNVKGRLTNNEFGKCSFNGTLMKDGTITLFLLNMNDTK